MDTIGRNRAMSRNKKTAITTTRREAHDAGPPVAVDLFAGAGGLTLGLRRAGFNVRGAVENDPLAVETYRRNHRRTFVWQSDIRDLPAGAVMKEIGLRRGQLDLLAGCPPCQGFSSVRTWNGGRRVRDPRNALVGEFGRFAEALLPRAVMLENVPRLARERRLQQLVGLLRELGYKVRFGVLDARDYAVAQRRQRFILIGARDRDVDFAPPARGRLSVRKVIGSLRPAGSSGDPLHDHGEQRSDAVASRIALIPRDGGSRADLGPRAQLDCHRECDGFHDIYGRLAWDDVAPTITGGCINPSKGRFLHPEENRALTLREAALLQGFPSHYWFSLRKGKYAAAQLIGNALPPPFVARHARVLR